jgi:antitoxin HigA-1
MKQSIVMPTKTTPAHPGERIADVLEELGLSVAVAAKALGISRQQLHNVIAARAGVTPEMALRLEKALGSAAQTWLAMQSEYNLAQVRRAAIKVSALRRARAKRA